MKVCLVTGFIPGGNSYRSTADYVALGEKLAEVPVPTAAYFNNIEDTWMFKYLRSLPFTYTHSVGTLASKDTLAYHCITHEKTAWLVRAAEEYPEFDIYVWVDYGIFHLPGMTTQAVVEFTEKLDNRRLYFPGWWQQGAITADVCNWRFCGSMFAVPKEFVHQLDAEVRDVARKHIMATRNVEWEVNTWARLELITSLPIHWYRGQHMANMFTNFEAPDDRS